MRERRSTAGPLWMRRQVGVSGERRSTSTAPQPPSHYVGCLPMSGSLVTAVPYEEVSRSSRTLGMMAHVSTIVGFFLTVPVAAGIVGPGVLWMIWHRRDAFVTGQAREAVNFHVSVLLYALLLQALPTPPSLVAVAVVVWMTLVVVVAGLAYEGRPARYPVALPILRAPRFKRG